MSILITIISILLILSLWGFYTAIYPFKLTSTLTPKKFGLSYEDVSFKTKDNVLIRGWFVPNPNPKAPAIILMHGYPADKGDILALTHFLHQKYHLLYFDFRYLGNSGGSHSTLGKNEVMDLQAAIRFLVTRNIHTIGIWGFSLGGAVALMAAPSTPEIKAIVAESSYARLDWIANDFYRIPVLNHVLGELMRLWGWIFLGFDIKKISPALYAEKIHVPVLLIHSRDDDVIPFKHALLLQNALRDNPHAKLLINDSGGHGKHTQSNDQAIQDFFAAYLHAQ
ncbi:alpha/beta hydrolase [Aquicella siphonis]|uniref:alpha/beta hydrolase n=1 Tax=Aquicella siphonis TaxID=254247 RepID=UPI00155B3DF8|nr:alpha/beta fold hydrolase [Aquicella siphonis]